MKKIEALKRARDALLAAPTAYRAPETIAFIDEALSEQPAQAFNDWWDSGYDPTGNPFRKGSAAYWAWAGWKAAITKGEQA